MKLHPLAQQLIQRVRAHPRVSTGVGVGVLVLLTALIFRSGSETKEASYFEVQRGDFLISVVEGGTVEAVNEVSVRSEVEGTARIIFIVPEGSYVKKGNLLVELDSSSSLDSVNQQQINVEKAQFFLIQAEQQLEIQKSTVESEIAAAKLRVEFAQSDLDKHMKGEALQTRRDAQIEITNVVENLGINQERLDWTEKLYKEGYETKANLDKDRLAVSQSRLKLEQAEKSMWMLETFDQPKKRRSLEAALQEATENFDRVKLQGERKLAQFQADVQSQRKTLELSQSKLDRDRKQLEATKIYAPQDGLVVYASGGGGRWSNESMIEEGAIVRNRQEIIKLPDVSEMKLQVRIHESHINQIRHGLSAFVVLDSMPDQRYHGVITKVAPLPDSQSRWGNPNLKVYATEIRITDRLPDVKPGVSARAEIIVTNLANVLTVPIQAVTTLRGQQMAYVAGDPPRPVAVGVGMYNEKFIEITSGLKEGDRVLLAPPFDTQEKDLGGAILARGETLPAADTNQVARVLARTPEVGEREGVAQALAGDASLSGARAITNAPEANGGAGPRERTAEEAATGERRPRVDGDSNGKSLTREEMLKRFDKNHDGQLDEAERATMRVQLGNRVGRSTNAPSPGAPRKPSDT
jgi:HlyD family secretion protein